MACRNICRVKDELNKVIQHFGKGGFDVITRGQMPPNPSELLMRDRMRHYWNGRTTMTIW